MKRKFNKNMGILNKNQIAIMEMKNSVSQIKTHLTAFPLNWTRLK
jgi:hypothetical protein